MYNCIINKLLSQNFINTIKTLIIDTKFWFASLAVPLEYYKKRDFTVHDVFCIETVILDTVNVNILIL